MSAQALDFLMKSYPGRPALRADEVALALGKKGGRGAVQRVREGMKNGRYPGARKIDGIWQLPLTSLAEIIEPEDEAPPLARTSGPSSRTGRRRSAIGPRLDFIRALDFWSGVFRSMGELEDAAWARSEAQELREQGTRERDIARSEEEARALRGATPTPLLHRGPIDTL